MNVTSGYIREKLKVFDGGFFGPKVSKNALLRDTGYWVPTMDDLREKVPASRLIMAKALGVSIDRLPHIHTGSNGRWDCDNYAISGCSNVQAIHDRECRENGHTDREQYAIIPFVRADIDHKQAICLTNDGWAIVEFITGEITQDLNIKILLVG